MHLLTIHKAKGLEFPIVVVVGGSRGGRAGGGEPIVDRDGRRVAIRLRAALPGSAAQTLEPASYTALAEREKRMSESELRRLLYVATTRARDHLVVSCFGKPTTKDGTPASGALLGPIAASLPAPAAVEDEYDDGGVLVLPPPQSPSPAAEDGDSDPQALLAERVAWVAQRRDLLERAARPAPATSPSGLEHVDEEVRTGGPGAPAGRARALALGSAVHRVMELCDLGDEASVAIAAEAAALELGRPDLAAETARLALACWRSAPVRAAARAAVADPDAVHRELAVGALVEGAVLSGAIDLLYRDDDEQVGRRRLQDRSGRRAGGAPRALPSAGSRLRRRGRGGPRRRRRQGRVLRPGPRRGEAVHVPVDDELRALARAEIVAAAGAGRALAPDELAAES